MVFRKDNLSAASGKKPKKAAPFREEMRKLMYGCGDDPNPDEKTLDLVEAYFEEVLINLVVQSSRRAQRHGSNSLRLSDVLHVIRKDDRKYLRMPYIINACQDIAKTTGDLNAQNRDLDEQAKKNLKMP